MNSLLIIIILALIVQEPATTDATLFQARQNHFNILLIHLIWLIATCIDIFLGFYLGKWIQKTFKGSRFEVFSNKWADKIERFIGRNGEKFVLILLGIINFPYINSFLASWLKLSFRNIFILIFIGDTIWYAIEWAINLGVRSLIPDPHLALYIIVGTALILSIFYKTLLNKLLK